MFSSVKSGRRGESFSLALFLVFFCLQLQRRDPLGHTDFDMALVHSTVQEVEALQARLEATEDDDKQRALEEDITGQILWFYWCGIRSEVNDRLLSHACRLRNRRDLTELVYECDDKCEYDDKDVYDDKDEYDDEDEYDDKDEYDDRYRSSWGLYNSAKFKRTLHVGPANDIADLQR
ncbi:hypothetical protein EDD17DRAFT_1535466 [Pisolithus thermaeus]|nr:hypothetical protein EDD17DRAFT_1535466 [Pisolithus thermaeus]